MFTIPGQAASRAAEPFTDRTARREAQPGTTHRREDTGARQARRDGMAAEQSRVRTIRGQVDMELRLRAIMRTVSGGTPWLRAATSGCKRDM